MNLGAQIQTSVASQDTPGKPELTAFRDNLNTVWLRHMGKNNLFESFMYFFETRSPYVACLELVGSSVPPQPPQ